MLSEEKLLDLHEQLAVVMDEKTFLAFAHALAADKRAGSDWENTNLETFLEAAIAWAEGSEFGTRQGLSSSNPWAQFATFLYCGKIYE